MRYNRLYKDNNFLTPTTYTQTLSEYAANLKYEDIPPEVVERAKMILLQTLGVTLGAKGTPIYKKALRMAKEANGGAGGATTMWGTGEKLSAINAALALGGFTSGLAVADVTPAIQRGIAMGFTVFPAVAVAIGLVIMVFGYRLTKERVNECSAEIARRKEQQK